MTEKNVSMIGGVGAGKTTFLVALWHVISNQRKPHKVKLEALPAVRDRLNELEESWMQCVPVPRTPLSLSNDMTVGQISVEGGAALTLRMPDRSGETFHQQWASREVAPEYAEAIRRAAGVLLFLNPGSLRQPQNIDSTVQELASIAGIDEPKGRRPRSREASDAPDQVVLVELLQFVQDLRGTLKPPRLAVIISAWDLVEDDGLSPRKWLERYAPLLGQFLEANESAWSPRIFGVSACGGDLGRDKERLLGFEVAADRPFIVDESGSRLDDFTLAIASVLL